ncbi:tripartite tricarboxylate transporter substrate-binding protein [Polaromonas sp.]|uniref:tripartite tricarboxylate transporter substrate-binding protein n=1 Tax=Polaromonas sp. TaxID=1869339 RepID=UPI0032639715
MFKAVCLAIMLVFCADLARAQQAYPTKPVTIIVPFAAGGPMDKLARELATPLQAQLGQPVLVQNLSGAGGNLGTAIAMRAPADGHTLLMGHIGMATSPTLYRNLGFKPEVDFEPLGVVVDTPSVLVARSQVPTESVVDLIRWMAMQPQVRLANSGIGSSSHLCGLLLQSSLKVSSITTVPYRGSAPAVADLLGGHVDMICDPTPTTIGHIQSGKLKPIAVTTAKPLTGTPLAAVPTMARFGIADVEMSVWFALYAPKGTPRHVQQRFNDALRVVMKSEAFKAAQIASGIQVVQDDRATLAGHKAFLSKETARWRPIIKAAGVYAD